MKLGLICIVIILTSASGAHAQFLENFDGAGTPEGWVTMTGDGNAAIDFKQHNGIATLTVDSREDKLNIWWAIARHRISGLDMKKLAKPEYELRVETRIKVSHAPRRVNLHFNHQRTTDFHSHLMEYDIPDTVNWHTISMTTSDFETRPGDSINSHLALMDWGIGVFHVKFDYFKVDVVSKSKAAPDLGSPLPYHPKPADPSSFQISEAALHDAMIDIEFRDRNFNDWYTRNASGDQARLLTLSGTQYVIMRWDLEKYRGKQVAGSGLLELSPYSVQRSPAFQKDFGMVRISEIIDGDPLWDDRTVTFDKLLSSKALEQVINTQMIIDDSVTWNEEGKLYFTISKPVLQRLIDGKSFGIAIKPLGSVNASFYSRENTKEGVIPKLRFSLK